MSVSAVKKLAAAGLGLLAAITLTGCRDAEVASHNLSVEADQFRVKRRITFINLVTGDYLFSVTGNCSINADNEDAQLEVTCKIGEDKYQKHYFGISPGATYLVEQLEYSDVSPYQYELVFKPEVLVPTVVR